MKIRLTVLAFILVFAGAGLGWRAFGYYPPATVSPMYTCSVAGFTLAPVVPGTYAMSGPFYVPLPGYTYTVSPLRPMAFRPEGQFTLTLVPPPRQLVSVAPRGVVPPLWTYAVFSSPVPLHKLVVYINKPFIMGDRFITCRITGAEIK